MTITINSKEYSIEIGNVVWKTVKEECNFSPFGNPLAFSTDPKAVEVACKKAIELAGGKIDAKELDKMDTQEVFLNARVFMKELSEAIEYVNSLDEKK
tara:strand:- start:11 stop:304 length:294 start_codon:yes stop_codon:yes gene_type:complete